MNEARLSAHEMAPGRARDLLASEVGAEFVEVFGHGSLQVEYYLVFFYGPDGGEEDAWRRPT